MSCQPSTWTDRERRLIRALAHAVHRNHPFDAADCAGCREVAGFLTMPGYEGDAHAPMCYRPATDQDGHEADRRPFPGRTVDFEFLYGIGDFVDGGIGCTCGDHDDKLCPLHGTEADDVIECTDYHEVQEADRRPDGRQLLFGV